MKPAKKSEQWGGQDNGKKERERKINKPEHQRSNQEWLRVLTRVNLNDREWQPVYTNSGHLVETLTVYI